MKIAISFVIGVVVGAAGLTFSDVARIADRGIDAAKTVVQQQVK